MSWTRRALIIALPFAGYYVIDKQLSKRYPNIPLSEFPEEMRARKYLTRTEMTYYPYIDCYKTTITAPSSASAGSILSHFLSLPLLQKIIWPKPGTSGPPLVSKLTEFHGSEREGSAIIQWSWSPKVKLVSFFETAAEKYFYPFRLMNGGIHEVFVQEADPGNSIGSGKMFDVFFLSAHEYNDKHDGKIMPEWTANLHRNYARVILYFGAQP